MARTMLLARDTWDCVLDASRNIAVADEPYAITQDAASALRLFLGEAWFDSARGLPYFESILGQRPPLSLLKSRYVAAAMSVPGVVAAKAFITDIDADRQITGQVQLTTAAGATLAVETEAFGRTQPRLPYVPNVLAFSSSTTTPPVVSAEPMPPVSATLNLLSIIPGTNTLAVDAVLSWRPASSGPAVGSWRVQFSPDGGSLWSVDQTLTDPGTQTTRATIIASSLAALSIGARVAAVAADGLSQSPWTVAPTKPQVYVALADIDADTGSRLDIGIQRLMTLVEVKATSGIGHWASLWSVEFSAEFGPLLGEPYGVQKSIASARSDAAGALHADGTVAPP